MTLSVGEIRGRVIHGLLVIVVVGGMAALAYVAFSTPEPPLPPKYNDSFGHRCYREFLVQDARGFHCTNTGVNDAR